MEDYEANQEEHIMDGNENGNGNGGGGEKNATSNKRSVDGMLDGGEDNEEQRAVMVGSTDTSTSSRADGNDAKRFRHDDKYADLATSSLSSSSAGMMIHNHIDVGAVTKTATKTATGPMEEQQPKTAIATVDDSDQTKEVAVAVVVEDNPSDSGSGSGSGSGSTSANGGGNASTRKGYSRGQMIMSANPGEEERWRAHRITEDYVNLAANIMYPATRLAPFGYDAPSGQYPIEAITALGLLTSPLRRPTVVEKWSPYEIAIFESSIALCGKQFHDIQKIIKSKNTKEIIEFYYVWKKTAHYKVWKREYLPSDEDMDSDDD